MKKLLIAFILLFVHQLSGQNFCHTTEKQNEWFEKHPELQAAFDRYQRECAELDRAYYETGYQKSGKSAAISNHTIPVVFHILHSGGTENISDAQVEDAVNILTRDFNARNPDTTEVDELFKHLVGKTNIDFVLARRDPNGACTNGIIRHFDANTDWQGGFYSYLYTWPPNMYLNVYVVRSINSGAAGYTYFPGTGIPAVMDAVVIRHDYVGSVGSGQPYTSRALTHEVGHWLNLQHTWGNSNNPGISCGNDGVSDTPITKGHTSCDLWSTDVCTPQVHENVQNYMEYSYYHRMFTKGQAARMQNALNSPISGRSNLPSALNLTATGVQFPVYNCVPQVDISAKPSNTACAGTSVTISSYTWNTTPTSYWWSVTNGGMISDPTIESTQVVFPSPGNYIVSCTVDNYNGSDTQTMTVYVMDSDIQISTTAMESFQTAVESPPPFWQIINTTTPDQKWQLIDSLGSDGAGCMMLPGEKFDANTVEVLQSPSFDFKSNPGVEFSFRYAYALKNTWHKDVFKVQASEDCGTTWTDVWTPKASDLAELSGGVRSELFIPTRSEWKVKVMSDERLFLPFLQKQHVFIRFYFKEDHGGIGHGNRFFLDEVNFYSTVALNEFSKTIGFHVYPNPTSSQFTLSFRLSDAATITYEIQDVGGAVFMKGSEQVHAAGTHEIKLERPAHMAAGFYFINLEVNGVKVIRKIIVQ